MLRRSRYALATAAPLLLLCCCLLPSSSHSQIADSSSPPAPPPYNEVKRSKDWSVTAKIVEERIATLRSRRRTTSRRADAAPVVATSLQATSDCGDDDLSCEKKAANSIATARNLQQQDGAAVAPGDDEQPSTNSSTTTLQDTAAAASLDPCQGLDSCDKCQEATSNLDGDAFICFWSADQSCSKVSKADHADAENMCTAAAAARVAEQTPEDPCAADDLDSCEKCKDATTKLPADGEDVCFWNTDDKKCSKAAKAEHPEAEKMCDAAAPAADADPCAADEVDSCEKCKDATTAKLPSEGDDICLWNEGDKKCSKVTKADHPEAEKMCDAAAAADAAPADGDPCAKEDVDSCEKCKDASSSLPADGDDICFWNGDDKKCSKATKADHPEAEKMCDAAAPSDADTADDPCAKEDIDSCDKCKDATTKLPENGDNICFWNNDDKKCSKATKTDHPEAEKMCDAAPVDGDADPCAKEDVDSCEKCKDASSSLPADGDGICFWNEDDKKCSKATKTDHPEAEKMCEAAAPSDAAPADDADPCAKEGVDSCDKCKDATTKLLEGDDICFWNDGDKACTKSKKADHPEVENMCESAPAEEDPCAKEDVDSCDKCKDATTKLPEDGDDVCFWNDSDKTCTKSKKADHPEAEKMCESAPVVDEDPCAKEDVDSCDKCKDASSGLPSDGDDICFWSDEKCVKSTKTDHPDAEKMCAPPPEPVDPCANEDVDSCEKCEGATSNLPSDGDDICFWDGDDEKCIKSSKTAHPDSDKMCAPPPEPVDPCAKEDVDSCEKCKDATSNLDGDDICFWDGDKEKCIKSSKMAHPDAEKMCAPPPEPVDPCAKDDLDSCDKCHAASENLPDDGGDICYWDDGACTKVPLADHADADKRCNPCKNANSCKQCQEAVSKLVEKKYVCLWYEDDKQCSKMSKQGSPSPEDMCKAKGSSDDGAADGGDQDYDTSDDEGISPAIKFAGVALLGACVCCIFQRRRKAAMGYQEMHHSGPVRVHKTGVYEGVSTKEKADSGDEWDWGEDSVGDVELGPNNSKSRYHDQPLRTGHRQDEVLTRRTPSEDGMDSPPTRPKPAVPGMVLGGRSPPAIVSGRKGMSLGGTTGVQKPRATKFPSPAKRPGGGQPLITAVPPPPKGDIFSEMGFAAQPTFGAAAARPMATAPAAAKTSRSLGATHLPSDDEGMGGDDWGDDDLDDLLGD